MAVLYKDGNRLVRRVGHEQLWIEPWGANSLRVRATVLPEMCREDWALLPSGNSDAQVIIEGGAACVTNGELSARINHEGWITFLNARGEALLEEYWRDNRDLSRYTVPLGLSARQMKPRPGSGDLGLTVRFEAYEGEKIFGMGQYQDARLDKKGCVLELAQRNSQASVPFYVSNRGYGFLWNNPAVGEVSFGCNRTEWKAENTRGLDYWVTAGGTPGQIEEQYACATGKAPMMPDYGMGFWQCRLRYRTQGELLSVAREHKRRGLPLDVIVVDFFHWKHMGDWKFDPIDWPDPDAMVRELREMGVELAVSVWPTVAIRSENYEAMREQGYLMGVDRGARLNSAWIEENLYFDATNPGAREYVWQSVKRNYYEKGIKIFWLDSAEPEMTYDFDIYRYHMGPALQVSNLYPAMFAKGFFDGMAAAGQRNILNLVRCAWAGSQRYGALVWSGDIHSSFRTMREQLQAGLSMAMAGIPWWTTDIGGFVGARTDDPRFHELLARWFEWGTFCPVMRLHGARLPMQPLEPEYRDGVPQCPSGADNEVWSFGGDVYEILKKYLALRERLRPYIREQMLRAHENGAPVMRPLFYDFPEDKACWDMEDEYMFGPDLLVAPVMEEGAHKRAIYLPQGARWQDFWNGKSFGGGQMVEAETPLGSIPVFVRDGKPVG